MQLKFESDQEFQLQAIGAVSSIFDGQPRIESELEFSLEGDFAAVPNWFGMADADILKNLQAIQQANRIGTDPALQYIEETVPTAAGMTPVSFPNFSVEMETGTGKTYVYIRTIHELFRCYGMRKFIIVVPSVAVREGVLKTLDITRDHIKELYGNTPCRHYVYDSDNLSQVRQFALSNGIEILVMTIDSFNKATNVIRQSTDRLQGETPIHLIQATRPILILDEPQNMESELRIKALAALNPLFAIRYSATHRNPYNVVYRLTPYEAYRQRLVKKIEVAGIEKCDDENQAFVRLESIQAKKSMITATLTVHKLMKTGAVKEQTVTIRPGDDLEEKTNRPEYKGFVIDEISRSRGHVVFANGIEIRQGESRGADKDAVFESQIRYTIEEHFRKQKELRPSGIKVLTLFFIDRVDNYVKEDGIIRVLFNKCFNEIKADHEEWSKTEPESVQASYFASKRKKTGEVVYEDSKSGETDKDKEAYDLIMREKEKLLSFDEPRSFIFSHSALKEGWDNPNIFQICTLNQSVSEIKKRQEIGRGVRIAVNQNGERVRDERVNVLTVVANESYQEYVDRLQKETLDEYGDGVLPPPPGNARRKEKMKLRKHYLVKPEFKELWDRIKHKTRYAVKIDTDRLVDEVAAELKMQSIRPPRMAVTRGEIDVGKEDQYSALQTTQTKTVLEISKTQELPNIVDAMAGVLERTSPPLRLTKRTLFEVFRHFDKKNVVMKNPHEFVSVACRIIRSKLLSQIIDGIKYEKVEEWFDMKRLAEDDENERWSNYLVPARNSLYTKVYFESDVEEEFAKALDKRDDVKLFFKLPPWFEVKTPLGGYNPDWAIVMEQRDAHGRPTGEEMLYLIRETKSTTDESKRRVEENGKVECGRKHFVDALGVNYRVVTSASDLP